MLLSFFRKRPHKLPNTFHVSSTRIASLTGFFLVVMFWNISNAQDTTQTKTGWKFSVSTNATITLNSYSDNWSGDEFSTFSWMWQFTGTAEKVINPKMLNLNTLKLAYGQTSLQDEDSITGIKDWQPMKKSLDLIDLESLLRFTFKAFVDPFISVRGVSQFADLRSASHNYYGNPLTITESFGAIKSLIKNDYIDWTARIGGAARQSIERNKLLPDSLKPIKETTNDGGLEFVTDIKAKTKDDRLQFSSELKVYEALFSSIATNSDEIDDWQYPDIVWENSLDIKLIKYIALNLYAQFLYDREIDNSLRHRQTVGVALTYSAKNF